MMQKPCQDSYYTLFSSYTMLLDYHEEQAKNSRWIRCKVADLQVEPLGESSPLIGNLSAFAAGTSQEAVKDTAENLGLAMRVNGELYPVRMTAYKSLLDRAKIGGTALPKLSREVLAEVLNECLKLYSADALLLIRDEKISAVHSGDEVDYSVLPIDELLKVLQAKLDARFSGNEFESGYCDHSLVSASWRMPDQKEDLLGTYAKVLAAQGKATMASKLMPGIADGPESDPVVCNKVYGRRGNSQCSKANLRICTTESFSVKQNKFGGGRKSAAPGKEVVWKRFICGILSHCLGYRIPRPVKARTMYSVHAVTRTLGKSI